MTCGPLFTLLPGNEHKGFQRAVSKSELMNISSPPTQPSVLSDFLIEMREKVTFLKF
jgi:hypothetical protein